MSLYRLICFQNHSLKSLPHHEILRGYFGDKQAPERFRDDDIVKAGFIEIGPGKVLSGLIKRISKEIKIDTINNQGDIKGLKI